MSVLFWFGLAWIVGAIVTTVWIADDKGELTLNDLGLSVLFGFFGLVVVVCEALDKLEIPVPSEIVLWRRK